MFGVDRIGLGRTDASIADAGSMGQQIPDSNFALGGHRRISSIRSIILIEYLWLAEGRNIFGQWVVEQKTPLFIQHHHRNARNGLGLRSDAEYGIRLQRLAALQIGVTKSLVIDNLAVPSYQRHGAGDVAAIHVFLHHAADALQPFAAHFHGFWRCFRQRLGSDKKSQHHKGAQQ